MQVTLLLRHAGWGAQSQLSASIWAVAGPQPLRLGRSGGYAGAETGLRRRLRFSDVGTLWERLRQTKILMNSSRCPDRVLRSASCSKGSPFYLPAVHPLSITSLKYRIKLAAMSRSGSPPAPAPAPMAQSQTLSATRINVLEKLLRHEVGLHQATKSMLMQSQAYCKAWENAHNAAQSEFTFGD